MTSSPTPMTRGYIMTLCGGLCWAIGGACRQVMFRDCGVTSDWLVPIRLFTGGIITLLIAALTGGKPLEPVRCRDAWPDILGFFLILVTIPIMAIGKAKEA